ncbi:MAG: zinc metallopeptidase [Acetobacterium sp.]
MFYLTFIILIPGLLLAAYAQYQVSSAYKTYSNVPTKTGITGAGAARAILNTNDLKTVGIEEIGGNLTDHYDPRKKVMRLSQGVSQKASLAAVGIAAHETGHALQDKDGYWPLRFRNFIVPIAGFGSNLAWPLFFIGFFFAQAGSTFGVTFMNLGILLFSVAFVFTIITLPVEFNASSRAVKTLIDNQIIQPGEEVGVKKVLRAAALTYVAAALMAFLNLLRLVLLRGSRN